MHKINNSIDNFYKNSLKTEDLQLFSIKEHWSNLTSKEIANVSQPYKLKSNQNGKILFIKTSAPSLSSSFIYVQQKLFEDILRNCNVQINQLKFISF
ncbi:MAG: hypothetical protein ISQ32_02540 [Rickettsiales bacterium]|nr:hypothetical protein [Rickettsiales bacterium]